MKQKVVTIVSERGDKLQPIPLRVIEPHRRQALINYGQSLLQLELRGGITPKEALHILKDLRSDGNEESNRIHRLTFDEAHREMVLLVRKIYGEQLEEEERHSIYHPCTHPERPVDITYGIRKCGRCRGPVAMTP